MPGLPRYLYNYFWVTFITILVVVVLTTLHIPTVPEGVLPAWMLLAVVYLVLTHPDRYGIYFGFILGLLNDMLIGNQLGLHALTYTGICYFLLKMNQRIAFFPIGQQCLLIFILVLIDRCAIALVNSGLFTINFMLYALLSSVFTIGCLLILINLFGSRSQMLKRCN